MFSCLSATTKRYLVEERVGGPVAATPSSAATVQSRLADSTARKNGRGSSLTYLVSRPTPRVSTARTSGRPLTSLWTVTRNVPVPGAVSFLVSQRRRSEPVSLMKGSVCIDPRPDHDPRLRQTTAGVLARGASLRHDARTTPVRTRIDNRGGQQSGTWIRRRMCDQQITRDRGALALVVGWSASLSGERRGSAAASGAPTSPRSSPDSQRAEGESLALLR